MSRLAGLGKIVRGVAQGAGKGLDAAFTAGGVAAGTGLLAMDVGQLLAEPVARGLYESRNKDQMVEAAAVGNVRLDGMASLTRMRIERLAEMRNRNEAIIAQSDPQLYASLKVGRRLKRGEIVIGGALRRDLIEELADSMGNPSGV